MQFGFWLVGTAGAAGGLALVAMLGITARASFLATHPAHGVFDAPRLGDGLQREEVRFASRDGTVLAAWFIAGTRRQTVLLLHGYTACKDDMLSHAAFLHEAGYTVLLLDFRACGDSAGSVVTLGGREREDVQAAIAYLLGREDVDGDALGVLGLSLGASLAILGACDSPAVRAVVAEGAFGSVRGAIRQNFQRETHLPWFPWAELTTRLAEWRYHVSASRVAPEREVARLRRCALLLIHAQDDPIIPIVQGEAIFRQAPDPKEFWRIPHAPHAMAFKELEHEYAQRVVSFFDCWLSAASPLGPIVSDAGEGAERRGRETA